MEAIYHMPRLQEKLIEDIVKKHDTSLPGHKGKTSYMSHLEIGEAAIFYSVYSRFPKDVRRKKFLERLKKELPIKNKDIYVAEEDEEKENRIDNSSENRRTYIKTQQKIDAKKLTQRTEKEYRRCLKEKKKIRLPETLPPGSYWGRLYLYVMSHELFKQEETLLKKINNAVSSIYSTLKH